MIAKKALAVSVTLVVLAACAKNGVSLRRTTAHVTPPRAVQKVVRVYDHPKQPISVQVKVSNTTSPKIATGNAVIVARVQATSEPTTRPKPRKKFGKITALLASATDTKNAKGCDSIQKATFPDRAPRSLTGSQVVKKSLALGGVERDRFVAGQVLAGNVPNFLRTLSPVSFKGKTASGKMITVTICVTPDYLAVGSDKNFVRVPMGLPAAAEVANDLGYVLPTTKMVDAIYRQAGFKLAPSPMTPGKQMTSTSYLWKHNQTVEDQLHAAHQGQDVLIAGQKKDLVLSNVLRATPGRVAIYGWHRLSGLPIQPLSTVHGESYADYSHGIRLVRRTAFINGKPTSLAKLLEDPQTASLISKEGPIRHPLRLLAAISLK